MRPHRELLLALILAGLTVAIYWQAAGFAFVNYDDHRYVYENPRVLAGVTGDNIAWAFTTFEFSNWHPLTWLSLMLDASLLGPDSRGFHITSILLHATNAALLLILLARLTGSMWRSTLVAALFALHPLHVESVAWISERKDVLSTFFGLLAMLAYVRFAVVRESDRGDASIPWQRGRHLAYLLVVICFALSLMSKPMLVTLPFVLLLLDWWPLGRVRSSRDWINLSIEKFPLLAMSAASCVLTIAAQNIGEAIRDLQHVSVAQRLGNAIAAYGEYLRQTIWPSDLAVFYPLPSAWPATHIALAALAIVAITLVCAIASRRTTRAPLVGWLWFLGTLIPVIGLVQVGAQAHADRYTYVPLIGVFIMFAWMLPASPPAALRASIIGATSCVIALAAVCWFQIGYWRDSSTLALRALDVTSKNFIAHTLLGNALVEAGRYEDGAAQLQEATRIEPTSPQAWHNLGFALAQLGMNGEAMQAYRTAIALRPNFAENHFNLGLLLRAEGKLDEARMALQRARELANAAGDDALAAEANAQLENLDTPE